MPLAVWYNTNNKHFLVNKHKNTQQHYYSSARRHCPQRYLPLAQAVRTFPRYNTLQLGSYSVIVTDLLLHSLPNPSLTLLRARSRKSLASISHPSHTATGHRLASTALEPALPPPLHLPVCAPPPLRHPPADLQPLVVGTSCLHSPVLLPRL